MSTTQRSPSGGSSLKVIAITWALMLTVGSLQPERPGNIHTGAPHHIAHIFSFGLLAFLAAIGFARRRLPAWPAALSFLLGCAIEFAQHLQNNRPVEWYDIREDAIGVVLAIIVFRILDQSANLKVV